MRIVAERGEAWPGMGLVLGGALGVAVGGLLWPLVGADALWIGGGVGSLGGLISGVGAAAWVRRKR